MRTGPLAVLLASALPLAGCTGTDALAADPSSQVAPAASDEPTFTPPAGVTTTVLDDAGPTTENVDAAVVGNALVASHPEAHRLYDVPLRLLGR